MRVADAASAVATAATVGSRRHQPGIHAMVLIAVGVEVVSVVARG